MEKIQVSNVNSEVVERREADTELDTEREGRGARDTTRGRGERERRERA